jgi:DNA-binding CsgD family transcriptional regulator
MLSGRMEAGATSELLVGRERELAEIEAFLERAGPAALALEGEPGIGKTTLWRAGVDSARERGRRVLEARPAEAERELSFSALGDLLGPALDRLEALSSPRRRALELALLLASDEGAAPDARAIGLATLDLLRLLADEQPLLVAVDDTQWLDPPSRETLAYALRRLDQEPVALLAAHRPGADELVLGRSERVVVGPLSVGALNELLRDRVGARLTRPTLVRVHETADGNPFFALELARALEGRELGPGEPLPVPASLGELAASRFERLDADTREVLLLVAALAHPTVEVVTVAAGDRATRALEAAAAAGLIEADGSRLRFTHPLLASVHYGSATPDDRAGVHRRLAAVVTDAEERGRHLGAAATEPDAEVAAALDNAAAAARARGAPAAAAELAEGAIRLTSPTDQAVTLSRLMSAADHQFAAGSTARARSLLEQALAVAPRGPERARVALQLAALLDSQDLVAERPLLARALLEAEGDTMLRAEIHDRLAIYFNNADWRESRRHAHMAFGLAERIGDPELIAGTLAASFERDFRVGTGIDHTLIRRGIALEERLPQLGLLRRPSRSYAFALQRSGDVERARPIYERLRALGRSEGDPYLISILFYSAFHELLSERWEQAARYADESRMLAVEAERDVEVAAGLGACVVVAAYRGQVEPARSDAAEAARLADAVGLSHRLFGFALGVLDLSLNEPASALGHLRPATEEKLSTGVQEPGLFVGFPEHVEAAIAADELAEASELLDFVEEHARRLDRAWALACAARGRALLASARGDYAAAEDAFARAYEQHARRPQQLPTYELARTLLVHGSILRRRQRKRQAREALERALAIFERLGAQVYAERARSELARIGGRTAAAGGELSETERRIAELVAQGRSNKEVAAALSLSPKTVEWNLSKVYAKLGVRSRAELAARVRG